MGMRPGDIEQHLIHRQDHLKANFAVCQFNGPPPGPGVSAISF
jgi:hypothetical protein